MDRPYLAGRTDKNKVPGEVLTDLPDAGGQLEITMVKRSPKESAPWTVLFMGLLSTNLVTYIPLPVSLRASPVAERLGVGQV